MFNLDENKVCKNCLKGKIIKVNGDILCNVNGIVSPSFSCKKYRSIKLKHFSINTLKCHQCAYFKFCEEIPEGKIGVCRLFTERKFNGNKKKACSRIILTAI